jgi:hypothetical protein
MSVRVTKDWSGRTGTSGNGTYTWEDQYAVSGVGTQGEALVANDGTNRIPQVNESLPGNARCRVQTVNATSVGPLYWKVRVSYGLIGGSSSLQNEPVRVSWSDADVNEPTDTLCGIPVQNTNGEPFDPPDEMEWKVNELTVTRTEPYFDNETISTYANTVNSNTLTLDHLGIRQTIWPGRMLMKSGVPEPYALGDPFMRVAYRFLIRWGGVPERAWMLRRMNRGSRGFYKDTSNNVKTGPFCYPGNSNKPGPLTGQIRIKEDGTPFDTTIRISNGWGVGATVATPIANPNWRRVVGCDYETLAEAFFIWFPKYPLSNFSGLAVLAPGSL